MPLEAAKVLIRRAQERASWIGDDHGSPYELALLNGNIPIEMHIALKEILDHLRSALDYSAREVCQAITGNAHSAVIYFPITTRGFAAADFPSRVGKLMPGVLHSRPELVTVFAGFQPFASPNNGWLADLATLANRTKHIDLAINTVETTDMTFANDPANGGVRFMLRRPDGTAFSVSGLALVEAPNGFGEPGTRLVHLWLEPIQQELLAFLRSALRGVRDIIDTIEQTL